MFRSTENNVQHLSEYYSEVKIHQVGEFLLENKKLRPGQFMKVGNTLVIAFADRDERRYGIHSAYWAIFAQLELKRSVPTGFVNVVLHTDDGTEHALGFVDDSQLYMFHRSDFSAVRTVTIDRRVKTRPATANEVNALTSEIEKLRKELESAKADKAEKPEEEDAPPHRARNRRSASDIIATEDK